MEGDERKREARVHLVPCLPQEQSIFHYMQYNHLLNSDRNRLCIDTLPGMYNMTCTQLLALANTTSSSSSVGAATFPNYDPNPQISMDSWVNSWKMESNPWILSPGSYIGTNTSISRATIMEQPQYDVPTSQKFICDLNLTPEETMSTTPRLTQAEDPPITLDTPGKKLPEPKVPIDKPFRETEKKRKRAKARDEEKAAAQLNTPPMISTKRKKVRGKVVREGDTKKPASKPVAVKKRSTTYTSTATPAPQESINTPAAKTSEESSSSARPKRSTRRSLNFDYDSQEEEDEDGYCGLTFTSEGDIGVCVGGKIIPDATMGVFGNIPKRRRTNGSDYLSSTLSLVNMVPGTFMELNGINLKNLARKRSSIVTRPRKIGSLKRILEGILPVKRDRKVYKTPLPLRPPQLEAIVSKIQSDVLRKKRSNRDPIASQLNVKVLNLQWQRQNSTGTSTLETCEEKALSKLFEELDITKENLCLVQNKESAIILHQKAYQDLKAMVRYRRDGSIIPSPDPKNHQPRVQLDDETTRVWKLLMVSIDSEGVDGTDEEKQKWWEEERNMFQGRANSFIARMRLVQGDRRFSPWKGSVVDSVVGVFLTQNVADHSSSSAFMDLAAEFPIISNSIKGSCLEELESSVTDPGTVVLTPRICNPTCIIIDEIDDDDDDDDTDGVCSQETSKTGDSSITSTNQSEIALLDPPTNSLESTHSDQGISTSTSTCCELNLNEVLLEVEICDAFTNKVDAMSNHLEELKSTLDAQDQEKNTSIDSDMKKKKMMKKPMKGESSKKKPAKKTSRESFDWDSLRREAESGGRKREKTERTMDTVDWDALRCTNVHKIAEIIKKRGMNNMLASRIKAFLNRLVQDHDGIDLEWLRDVQPDKAKEFLLSINGLGLKSVECVRLLSLHQIAFPVDTNVGRIAVRLGWVPLQPLPDELQMHLLDLYPVLESVQKYLWPRLCKLDQKTLYELHYHMITFGKVFCTKVKPNCKACPMKAECRHYASAHASARLALPEAEEESNTVTIHERINKSKPVVVKFGESLLLKQDKEQEEKKSQNCEPIIEEPASPEPECVEQEVGDIEDIEDIADYPYEMSTNFEVGSTSIDPWENKDVVPIIMINKEADLSKDMVVLSTPGGSIPRPKLKNKEKLRTEHLVFELPDSHPILEGFERREIDDEFPYLFAIWTPGETANSSRPPKQRCVLHEKNILCNEKTCFPCNNTREVDAQIVRGTILIPCRTAMRGGFPLNGTYFQTNEVFADHASSVNPIIVPRRWIWNLTRRIAYFGSSVTASFGGLSVEAIQYGFWRGYVCVRGFDRRTRKPKTLMKRLHCPPSNKNQDE